LKLRKTFGKIHKLPTLPPIVVTLENALRNENASADDIARIISNDISISSNILRLVNSAYYSPGTGSITSISEAVVRLGLHEIKQMCTTLAVISAFNKIGKFRNHVQFWKHCIAVANAARVILNNSRRSGHYTEDDAHIAGLLHDTGYLVLDQYFYEDVKGAWELAAGRGVPNHEVEQELLKIDHGEVGGHLLRKWKLPPHIVHGVSYHHQFQKPDIEDAELVRIVHLADAVCVEVGVGNGYGDITMEVTEESWISLDIGEQARERILEKVGGELSGSEIINYLGNDAPAELAGR